VRGGGAMQMHAKLWKKPSYLRLHPISGHAQKFCRRFAFGINMLSHVPTDYVVTRSWRGQCKRARLFMSLASGGSVRTEKASRCFAGFANER
jgi:hypothetical protein